MLGCHSGEDISLVDSIKAVHPDAGEQPFWLNMRILMHS
jgi:hypothetical protein